MVLTVKFIK